MPAPWKALEDEMSDVQSAEYAEPIRHVPMKRPDVNARAAPDAARAAYATRGIYAAAGYEVDTRMGKDMTRMPPAGRVSTVKPCVWVDRRDLQADVLQDDRILVLEQNILLEVVDIIPDGQGRLELRCNQIGRYSQ